MSNAPSTSGVRLFVAADQPTIAGEYTSTTNVDDADRAGDVGEVDDPDTVRSGGGEVPVHPVGGPLVAGISHRAPYLLPADHAAQAIGAHQPFRRAPGCRLAFAA
jgi:hypothetical protein